MEVPFYGSYLIGEDYLAVGWGGALLWMVGMTNVFNFMDGIDGLAGLQAVVAGAAWAIVGWQIDSILVLWFGLLILVSVMGFLAHNWSPAKIFMGDVGSAFMGFIFAFLPLLAISETPSVLIQGMGGRLLLFSVLVLWPFIGDAGLTLVRRTLNGERVWAPHRSHLYQRLVIIGWSHARVTLLYGAWALLSGAVGFLYLNSVWMSDLVCIVFPSGSLAGAWCGVTWLERRKRLC